MAFTYLGLGTNLGNKAFNLNTAFQHIEFEIGQILNTSSFFCSEAWGFDSANEFLNAVILVNTDLPPLDLLEVAKKIEQKMGRSEKKSGTYKDRIIDIDILFYDNLIMDLPTLKIPHPLIQMRNFVLIPMAEIAPKFIHPFLNEDIESLKHKLLFKSPEKAE